MRITGNRRRWNFPLGPWNAYHVNFMLFGCQAFFSCLVGFSFLALLVDPPWRQTQAESEGEESQGKGWEGSDASDASDGSDGSGRSPAVAKPLDKAGTAV